jgi:hypothetical protein
MEFKVDENLPAGLTALMIALLTFVSVTVVTSRSISSAQTFETEPNNDFEDANIVDIPGYVAGSAWNSITDTDYFVMETPIGREHVARITICSPDDLALRMVLYDGNRDFVEASPFSSSHTELSWTAYTTTYYIQVAASVLTETLQTADYRLDIYRLAPTPTPTLIAVRLPLILNSTGWVEPQLDPTPIDTE